MKPDDLKVQKTRYSAFIQGSSNLEAMLRARGIDTVIITGTVTNVCCESTARDAMMRNFRTIMVTDANAATSDELHNASLSAFYLKFGDIMPTEWSSPRSPRAPAPPPRNKHPTSRSAAALRRGAADGTSRACLGPAAISARPSRDAAR